MEKRVYQPSFLRILGDLAPQVLLDNVYCTFIVLSTNEERMYPSTQNCLRRAVGGPMKSTLGVNTDALDRLSNVDHAFRYVTNLLSDCLHHLILNFNLYVQGEG